MKKIPTIFKRYWPDKSRVVNTVNPGCEWVLAGEGVATRKYDGTCCAIMDGRFLKRREIKKGELMPHDFVPIELDLETGNTVGWIPVGDGPEDEYHREALVQGLPDGTYELLGPKIQGNPEHIDGRHILLNHKNAERYSNAPRDFDSLRDWLVGRNIEGLVFHHPDGRMAKIKLRDFGAKRQVPAPGVRPKHELEPEPDLEPESSIPLRAKYVSVCYASAIGIAEKWKVQYYMPNVGKWREMKWPDTTPEDIYNRLLDLGSNPDIEAAAEIIGNRSRTYLPCDSCEEYVARAIGIGTEVYCETCVREAYQVLKDLSK